MTSSSPSSLTPDQTPKSSRRSSRNKLSLSLDLSKVPPLITPSPPSNTLLITNLDDPAIFLPSNLQSLRDTISQHVSIYSFSPLRSFRRIIVTFFDTDSATLIRQQLDGSTIMDHRARVYFGAHTDISPTNQHLAAPKIDKLFFISPPPSPPHDWEVRAEEPPNKTVHAEDLAEALAALHPHGHNNNKDDDRPMADADAYANAPAAAASATTAAGSAVAARLARSGSSAGASGRVRSSSITVVYTPEQHGCNPSLPAISVEDTEFVESPQDDASPMDGVLQPSILHTSRPPVELMEH